MSGKMVPQSWASLPLLPNPCLELPPPPGRGPVLSPLLPPAGPAQPGAPRTPCPAWAGCSLCSTSSTTAVSGQKGHSSAQPRERRGGSQVRGGLGSAQCWAPSSFRVCPWTAGEEMAGGQGGAASSPHCDLAGPGGPRPGQKRWGRLLLPLCPLGRPSSCCHDACGPYPRVVSLTQRGHGEMYVLKQ